MTVPGPHQQPPRYELLGLVGEGGFATVYRAWDRMLGRQVALKALHPQYCADPEARRRFFAEIQAVAPLSHPNIVTFHDAGELQGRPFYTMDLVEGTTLEAMVSGGRSLPVPEVVTLIRRLASAVDYLHAAGIVHRDIKPANVMLDKTGRAVLMDFGIAWMLENSGHTRPGALLGTPEYMPPEQVQGHGEGPAADIYALGVLAYALLAGTPPFTGDYAHVLHAHVYDPPPLLSRRRPDLPPVFDAVFAQVLAKHPAYRPPTAIAFADALLTASRILAPPVTETVPLHLADMRAALAALSKTRPATRPRPAAGPPPPDIQPAVPPPIQRPAAPSPPPPPDIQPPAQRPAADMPPAAPPPATPVTHPAAASVPPVPPPAQRPAAPSPPLAPAVQVPARAAVPPPAPAQPPGGVPATPAIRPAAAASTTPAVPPPPAPVSAPAPVIRPAAAAPPSAPPGPVAAPAPAAPSVPPPAAVPPAAPPAVPVVRPAANSASPAPPAVDAPAAAAGPPPVPPPAQPATLAQPLASPPEPQRAPPPAPAAAASAASPPAPAQEPAKPRPSAAAAVPATVRLPGRGAPAVPPGEAERPRPDRASEAPPAGPPTPAGAAGGSTPPAPVWPPSAQAEPPQGAPAAAAAQISDAPTVETRPRRPDAVPPAETGAATGEARRRRWPLVLGAAATVLLAVVLGAAFLFGGDAAPRRGDATATATAPPVASPAAAGPGVAATPTATASPVPQPAAVAGLVVVDNAINATRSPFLADTSLFVCFQVVPGTEARGLKLVAVAGEAPPERPDGEAVVRLEGVHPEPAGVCAVTPVLNPPLAPGLYTLAVFEGTARLAAAGFEVLPPPPPPTPEPTPSPTPPPPSPTVVRTVVPPPQPPLQTVAPPPVATRTPEPTPSPTPPPPSTPSVVTRTPPPAASPVATRTPPAAIPR